MPRSHTTLSTSPRRSRAHRPFRHLLDRHGLWRHAGQIPPRDEFGPLVNLGLIRLSAVWHEERRVRQFVRRASRAELATFISLLAAIGEDFTIAEFVAEFPSTATRPSVLPVMERAAASTTPTSSAPSSVPSSATAR